MKQQAKVWAVQSAVSLAGRIRSSFDNTFTALVIVEGSANRGGGAQTSGVNMGSGLFTTTRQVRGTRNIALLLVVAVQPMSTTINDCTIAVKSAIGIVMLSAIGMENC